MQNSEKRIDEIITPNNYVHIFFGRKQKGDDLLRQLSDLSRKVRRCAAHFSAWPSPRQETTITCNNRICLPHNSTKVFTRIHSIRSTCFYIVYKFGIANRPTYNFPPSPPLFHLYTGHRQSSVSIRPSSEAPFFVRLDNNSE